MELAEVDRLKQRFSGEVYGPEDDSYEMFRNAGYHPGSPALIVRARTAEDVQQALQYGRERGLAVSIRGGGHSGAGFGTNAGGLVIDLSLMNEVELIDPAKRIVRIGGGARWIEVVTALAQHNLVISSGDTTTVGVGGLILGGGIGWMVRKSGLTLDNLVAAEIVSAKGQILRASARDNADLFWAIRGGGGNFGVVTAFEVRALPVKSVFFGKIMYPPAEFAQVIKGWRDYLRTAPDEVSTSAQLFPPFGGEQSPLILNVCFAGDDPQAAAEAIEPLFHLGTLISKDVKPMPYADILEEPGEMPPGFNPLNRNRLVQDWSDELIDRIAAHVAEHPAMFVEFRALGGAFGRVASDATAFGYRESQALLLGVIFAQTPESLAQFETFWEKVAPYTAGAYSNFLMTNTGDEARQVYSPETYARLAQVKRKYDPDNVFCQNYNIPPAN